MKEYDIIIIGTGVGLTLVNEALRRGLKVAIVEMGKVGGTCLTRGCIPSKVLVYPADIIREAEHARKVGVHFKLEKVDWDFISKRMWSQIDHSKEMAQSLKHVPGLDFYQGVGEFIGDYQMAIDLGTKTEEIVGEKIVIASGARSFVPPIPGLSEVDYITSETFFGEKFPKKPWKSLAIIGGGIIAAEFAHIFSAVGTKVTIIEMLPRLVTTEEPEISKFLEQAFRKQMTVFLNKKAVAVEGKKGQKIITIEDTDTKEQDQVSAEEILVATGRRSNADLLKPEKTGVQTDHGWIITNEYLETTKKNIWCIGDANGKYQFRHTSNYEAEIASTNVFAEEKHDHLTVDYHAVPWAIFTNPQIGHVGLTEAQALEQGYKIYVAIHNYSAVAKGFAMGFEEGDPDDGFVKLIIDQSRSILGASIIGPHAAILVQQYVYLMNAGFVCDLKMPHKDEPIKMYSKTCPEAGSVIPIYRSQIIHPSLNEVTGWALGSLRPVNIEHHDHSK
ncbi:MAG: dihydrolipoyl dehydrogenase [Candidatus Helarchaeota archaeon]